MSYQQHWVFRAFWSLKSRMKGEAGHGQPCPTPETRLLERTARRGKEKGQALPRTRLKEKVDVWSMPPSR